MQKIASICLLSLVVLACLPDSDYTSNPYQLPAMFEDGRVYVTPVTASGDSLVFFTDTGGPLLIYSNAVEQADLDTRRTTMQGMPMDAVFFPDFLDDAAIPSPLHTKGMIKVRPLEKRPPHQKFLKDDNGILGQAWFAGRTWTIDYPAEEFWLREPGDVPEHDPDQVIPLGFKTAEDGSIEHHFSRITIGASGEQYSMLLQTGGAVILSERARSQLGSDTHAFTTSFISESIFQTWREQNPHWRVIEKADFYYGTAMIEVPEITMGNAAAGPVWFTKRKDFAYKEWMSRFTDKQVVGAISGNALSDFRVTLDYVNARAIVQ